MDRRASAGSLSPSDLVAPLSLDRHLPCPLKMQTTTTTTIPHPTTTTDSTPERTMTRRPRCAADWGRLDDSHAAVRGRPDSDRRWPAGGRASTREALAEQLSDWRWFGVQGVVVVTRRRLARLVVFSSALILVAPRRQGIPRPPALAKYYPVSATPTKHPTPAWQSTPTRYLTLTGTPIPCFGHANKALDADKAPHADEAHHAHRTCYSLLHLLHKTPTPTGIPIPSLGDADKATAPTGTPIPRLAHVNKAPQARKASVLLSPPQTQLPARHHPPLPHPRLLPFISQNATPTRPSPKMHVPG
ncbi:hypothetical protein C8R44DRAFT_880430 [Mycena epipterygia]|nr:hypothetical protein C8R44DRAFT_880430 [Mycena epipterygia]